MEKLTLNSNCIVKPTHLAGKWIIKRKNEQLNDINKKDIKVGSFKISILLIGKEII